MAISGSASDHGATDSELFRQRIVIALDGAVDLESAQRLDRLFAVASGENARHVRLDMSALRLIDAAAISSVLRGMESLRAAGAELDVRYPSPMALQLFETSCAGQAVGIEFAPYSEEPLQSRPGALASNLPSTGRYPSSVPETASPDAQATEAPLTPYERTTRWALEQV